MHNYGAICSRIEEMLEQMKIEVVFEYSSKKLKVNEEFRHNKDSHFIKISDVKSKEIWKIYKEQVQIHNIKYFGKYLVKHKGNLCDRQVKEMIRIVDA